MIEIDATGKKGHLLYSPFTHKHFFRIYDPAVEGQESRRTFKDYLLAAEDIEVEILAGGLSLYQKEGEDDPGRERLDWSSRVLGRKPLKDK